MELRSGKRVDAGRGGGGGGDLRHQVLFQDEHQQEYDNGSLTSLNESPSSKVMRNTLIISEIVKHISTRELPKLRLLSRPWNSIILPQLKKEQHELVFAWDKYNSGKPRKYFDMTQLERFTAVMASSKEIPYTKFRLLGLCFNNETVRRFIKVCGKDIKSLAITLKENNNFTAAHLRQILQLCSGLEELEIHDQSDFPKHERWNRNLWNAEGKSFVLPGIKKITFLVSDCFDNILRPDKMICDLIKVAVNASHISIQLPGYIEQAASKWENWSLLSAIKEKMNLENIQILRLTGISTRELQFLVELTKIGLKLKELDIDSFKLRALAAKDGHLANEFLRGLSTSLEKLIVQTPTNDLNLLVTRGEDLTMKMTLPKMERLETLVIYVPSSSVLYHDPQLSSFTEHFPSLKTLQYRHPDDGFIQGSYNDIRQHWDQTWQQLFLSEYSHYGIEHLDIDEIDSVEKLEELAGRFPNIRHLNIGLSSLSALGQLWRKWPQLETLNITFSRFCSEFGATDQYLTGITTNQMDQLIQKKQFLLSEEELMSMKTGAGLSDLKFLKEFVLQLPKVLQATSSFGYYGIASMSKSIEKVRIEGFTDGRDGLSDHCMETLKQVFSTLWTCQFQDSLFEMHKN